MKVFVAPTCHSDGVEDRVPTSITDEFPCVLWLSAGQHQPALQPLLLQHQALTCLHLLPVLVPVHWGCQAGQLAPQLHMLSGHIGVGGLLVGADNPHRLLCHRETWDSART